MTAIVAVTNLILGVAYTGYGVMTAIEMKRGWKTMGFSHFGAAWIAMAFTCGPHHLAHGIHTAFEGRAGGPLDAFAVIVGLPVGVIWLLLRIEAMAGGRGDRFISGTPMWLKAMPTVAAVYLTMLAFGFVSVLRSGSWSVTTVVVPNVVLLFIYMQIGYFLLRTQLRNRPAEGGWSVSGLTLSAVFPTCGLMHLVFAAYMTVGVYHRDVHAFAIDWLSIPAALYFLWVVQALYRGTLRDWNEDKPAEVHVELVMR